MPNLPKTPNERSLAIGLGFRRGVTVEQIGNAVNTALKPHTMADVRCVATLESKVREPALVAFCERHRLRLIAFSTQDVQRCFTRHPSLTGSAIVQEKVGVEGVCEPCALLAAPGSKLMRKKRALDGVTVAIAASGPEDCMDIERSNASREGHDEDGH